MVARRSSARGERGRESGLGRDLLSEGGELHAIHERSTIGSAAQRELAGIRPATHSVVAHTQQRRSFAHSELSHIFLRIRVCFITFYPRLRDSLFGHGTRGAQCENRKMDAVNPRYSRQVALAGWGPEGQQKLADARVLVIGAGGLGSATIPALAASGVGTIGVIDDDLVETSNLHRQLIHSLADVGHSKVASAAESVAILNPNTRVIAMNLRLTAQNALSLFAEYDIVLDGCDNFPTRYLCNDAASLVDIPLVWGSVSQYGGQAGLSWASRGPTYRDLFPVPPAPGSVLSCEFGGVLPTIVATIGSLMATETIKLITGLGTPALGRVAVLDALAGSSRTLEYSRDPTAAPVRELIDYELFCGLAPNGHSLSPHEFAARTDDFTLLDVREPWEAEIATFPGAVLVPLGQLAAGVEALDPDKPVIVYCHHGIRSETARGLLAERGFEVANLTGGIDAWAREIDPAMARY